MLTELDRENIRRIQGFTKKSLFLVYKDGKLLGARVDEESARELGGEIQELRFNKWNLLIPLIGPSTFLKICYFSALGMLALQK